jgi:hypothetical protein
MFSHLEMVRRREQCGVALRGLDLDGVAHTRDSDTQES